MQKNGCPCCKNNLEMKQINFEEAVLICTNLKCPYPLEGDIKIYKRQLKEINSSITSLCVQKEVKNYEDCSYNKSQGIIRHYFSDAVKSPEFSKKPENVSHPYSMIDLDKKSFKILTTNDDVLKNPGNAHNNFGNTNEDSGGEHVVNIIIEKANNSNSDVVNNDNVVLEIELEVDPFSQEIILKTVNDHPHKVDETTALNASCEEKVGDTISALDYDINNILDAKIDELLKDAEVSSVASIETMSEHMDWLNELLEL